MIVYVLSREVMRFALLHGRTTSQPKNTINPEGGTAMQSYCIDRVKLRLGLAFIIVATALVVTGFAQAAIPKVTGVFNPIAGRMAIPLCVTPQTDQEFDIELQNTSTSKWTARITLMGVVMSWDPEGSDGGLKIASGTDHLVGTSFGPYWSVPMAPGKWATKHLFARIPNESPNKISPLYPAYSGRYYLTLMVNVDGLPGSEFYLSAEPIFCPRASMK